VYQSNNQLSDMRPLQPFLSLAFLDPRGGFRLLAIAVLWRSRYWRRILFPIQGQEREGAEQTAGAG
jgi:hypothetical protein